MALEKPTPRVRGTRGFTLIEVLVAVGIFGIMVSAITTLFTTMMDNQKALSGRFDAVSQAMAVQAVLMDSDACKATFDGMNPPTVTSANSETGQAITSIKSKSGAEFLNMGRTSSNGVIPGGQIFKSMYLQGTSDPAVGRLMINFLVPKTKIQIKPHVVTLALQRSGSNIVRCSANGVNTDRPSVAAFSCPTGMYLRGFDAAGEPLCEYLSTPTPTPTPASPCGGYLGYGSQVHSTTDDGSGALSGLACGKANGTANRCTSCSAQWIYPSGYSYKGGTVSCQCTGSGGGGTTSPCGGTQADGTVLSRVPDDGTGGYSGRLCGQSSGTAKTCISCGAQWIYPSGRPVAGGSVECRCSGGGTGSTGSTCSGTKTYNTVVFSQTDDGTGSLMGRMCGQSNGTAATCRSCSAQWIYPSGASRAGGQVECRCNY